MLARFLVTVALQGPSAGALQDVWWSPPTPEMIARVEIAAASLPLPHPLGKAERWYTASSRDGRHVVHAQYSWFADSRPGAFIAGRDPGLRVIADGGCGVYNIWYDWDAGKVTQAMCGGR